MLPRRGSVGQVGTTGVEVAGAGVDQVVPSKVNWAMRIEVPSTEVEEFESK